MRTILITGSNGFVGRELVRRLKNKPDNIRLFLIDKSYKKSVNLKNIVIIKGDISSPHAIKKIERIVKKIDIIVHLAATIYGKNLKDFYRDNVVGTRNLIKLAKNLKCRKFVFVSTDFTIFNMKKNYYGVTKKINEFDIRNSKIAYIILRFPPIFGLNDEKNFGKLFKLVNRLPIIFVPRCILNPIKIERAVEIIEEFIRSDVEDTIVNISGRFVLFKEILKKMKRKRLPLIIELPILFFYLPVFFQEKLLKKPLIYFYQLDKWRLNRKFIDRLHYDILS